MKLIIDANILMSALIATEGKTFDLILDESLELFSVDKLVQELDKHKEEILNKSGLTESEFDMFLSIVLSRIVFLQYSEDFKEEAEEISPDPNDTEYFALALKLRCGIWSNDKRLKDQDKVRVYSTHELMKEIPK